MNNTMLQLASMAGSERLKREKRLYEASLNGSVDSLKQLLVEDPLTLARAAVTCFDETPLHVALMLGHLDFAKFVVGHKPDMAKAVDSQGRSPLHLAAANGFVEIVNLLVSVNPNVCLFRDEDGRTPVHLAVMKGQVEVISELVRSQPEAAQFRLDQGDTLLHLAVKHNRLGALKLLLELGRDDDLVNVKDDDGNSILHIAAGLKQTETIKYLLNRTGVKVNAVNGKGFTPLDMIEYMPRDLKRMEVRESLVNSGALRAINVPALAREGQQFMGESDIIPVTETTQLAAPPPPPAAPLTEAKVRAPSRGSSMKIRMEKYENWLKEKRDGLMIAATVIAAMAYQTGFNPPSGVWQEDIPNDKGEIIHYAGTSIMASSYPDAYPQFMIYNTVSFVASLSIIFLLMSGLPIKKRVFIWILMVAMWITITFMALAHLISIKAVSPEHELGAICTEVDIVVHVWLGLMGIVIWIHTIRFLIWCVRKVRKLRKKKPSSLP